MALQYAGGTRVNTTFVNNAIGLDGKRQILFNVATAMQNAGWTVTTGTLTPTTDTLIMGSVATPNSNLRVKVHFETAPTNCTRLRVMRFADELVGTNVASGMFLIPANPKTWRVIANQHQVFVFETTGSNSGSNACFGTPWIPTWQNGVITQNYFAYGNRIADATATAVGSFRINLRGSYVNMHGNLYGNWNNTIIDHFNTVNASAGSGISLMTFGSPTLATVNEINKDWADGTEFFIDPLIKWPDTSTTGQKARVRGQLWDAAIVSGSYATEQTFLDGNGIRWYVFTDNSPIDNLTFAPGTLLLRVP